MTAPARTPSRFRFRAAAVLSMTAVWMMLWGSLSPVTFIGGILLGWLITVVFPLPPIHLSGRPHPLGVITLGWHLLRDLVVSSYAVIRLVWAREVDLHQAIVRADLFSDNDLYQVQVAEMISLVPGTVVVEIVRHPRRVYLHILDLDPTVSVDDAVADVRAMVREVEWRVLRAFGTAQEQEAFDLACRRAPEPSGHSDEWEVD